MLKNVHGHQGWGTKAPARGLSYMLKGLDYVLNHPITNATIETFKLDKIPLVKPVQNFTSDVLKFGSRQLDKIADKSESPP